MRIRTKILGMFSVMLAVLLLYLGACYFLTKKSIECLEDMRGEVNERKLTLEAEHLFILKELELSNFFLYPHEGSLERADYADKTFKAKLDQLEDQLRTCGGTAHVALLKTIRERNEAYNRESMLFARAEGKGAAAIKYLKSAEGFEGSVLSGLEDLGNETFKLLNEKERSFLLYEKAGILFPSFTPIVDAKRKIMTGVNELLADIALNISAHRESIAIRRFLLTGQDKYVSTYKKSLEESGRQAGDVFSSMTADSETERKTLEDVIELDKEISVAFFNATRAYRSGDAEGAKKTVLRAYMDEEVRDSSLDDLYTQEINLFTTAYASLPPMMQYTLSFIRQVFAVLSIVTILVFVAGSLLVKRMTRPINMLNDAAMKIAAGDWGQRVAVRTRDEIGEMAVSFNKMTEDLEEAEKELRASHEKYQSIVENVGVGIALVDAGMEMLGINSTMRKWFPELELPDGPYCFSHFEDDLIKAAEYGMKYESVCWVEGPAGPLYYRTVISPITDEPRHMAGAVVIFEDITQRLIMNQEKSRLIAELERSNHELQDFAYIASHDLQSPLRKVVSFSELLEASLKGRLSGDDLENLGYLVGGARHMQRLVNDLLSYSRIATRGKPPEPVDLGAVLKDALEISLAARLEETGGKVYLKGEPPWVMADATQLHQLLQNLIDNALKFRADGVVPEVIVSAERADGGFVRVEVKDNGIGIEARYHDKIFRMFQRLQGAGKYEGTGIGLSVCQRIVRRHGGDIGVHSRPGEGSTFWFTLHEAAGSQPQIEIKEAA